MKQSAIRFLLLALLLAVKTNLFAAFEVDGINYYWGAGGTVYVISKFGSFYEGDIVIPSEVVWGGKTYKVISIGEGAFSGCSNLTSVSIPNSVTNIENRAFAGCTSLTSMTIPNSVFTIGHSAFNGCSGLTSVTIPNSVTSIGNSAFRGCSSLTSVTIPNSVTSIGNEAFRGCSSLTSMTIPNSVTSIGYWAFSDCSNLTYVIIHCKKFGNCLSSNNSIKEVILGDEVQTIDDNAFYNCNGLTNVTIGKGLTSIGRCAFQGCSSLSSVAIPNNVTSIYDYTFADCSSLTSVTIGNGVTTIGGDAFINCTGLIDLIIGNSVTYIGCSAFRGCSSLTSVSIPNSVTTIEAGAFSECSSLTSVTIPSSVKNLSNSTFHDSFAIESVFYDSPKYESSLFGDSKNLRKTTLGENVEEVHISSNLLYLRCLSKTPPKLPDYSSVDIYVDTLEVPYGNSYKYVKDKEWKKVQLIFSVNDNTKYYPIPINYVGGTVVSINGNIEGFEAQKGEVVKIKALKGLSNNPLIMLRNQNISHILKEKGDYPVLVSKYHSDNTVFSFDFPLTNVTLSESGTLIDKINLDDILNIENLKITGNINGTDLLVIRKMENLKLLDLKDAHIVDGGMSYYKNYITSKNKIGNDFFSNKEKLYTVILPQDITEICEHAFGWCYELRTISIPKTVKTMNASIFPSCDFFNSVHIEDLAAYCSIKFSQYVWKYQERDMYLNDNKIVDMVIPDGVKSISAYAFDYLNGLNSLVIPSSVTKIGNYAFNCPIQESITCYNPTPPEIDMRTFGTPSGIGISPYSTVYDDVILYVPKGSKKLYWLHPYWEHFKNIVELGDTGIDDVTVDKHQQREGVYTIDGVKLSANADNTENLPKGIYIINGQKVVIK